MNYIFTSANINSLILFVISTIGTIVLNEVRKAAPTIKNYLRSKSILNTYTAIKKVSMDLYKENEVIADKLIKTGISKASNFGDKIRLRFPQITDAEINTFREAAHNEYLKDAQIIQTQIITADANTVAAAAITARTEIQATAQNTPDPNSAAPITVEAIVEDPGQVDPVQDLAKAASTVNIEPSSDPLPEPITTANTTITQTLTPKTIYVNEFGKEMIEKTTV